MNLEFFKHIYFRIPILIRLLLTILLAMLLFGSVIHFVEPTQFPTIFDGIWWAVVTGGTVGYGDYVPLTIVGRIIGMILILTGGGLITFYITQFASTTVQHENDLSQGKVAYKGNNHIILVGWNERTRILIGRMQKHYPKPEIVLIDQTLSSMSYQELPFHFIHGDPTDDFILQKANLAEASKVVVSANNHTNEKQADNLTILTVVAVRGNNNNIPIIVEILSTKQIDNAIRAGASTIIRPNDFLSALLYHEVFNNKTNSFESLIHLLKTQQFQHLKISEELINKPFSDALMALKSQEILLIGILRDKKWMINPKQDTRLQNGDIFITIIPWNQ